MPSKLKDILESTNYIWILLAGVVVASLWVGSYIFTVEANRSDIKDLQTEKKEINDRLYKIERDVSVIREKVSSINKSMDDIKRIVSEPRTTGVAVGFNR